MRRIVGGSSYEVCACHKNGHAPWARMTIHVSMWQIGIRSNTVVERRCGECESKTRMCLTGEWC